MKKGIIRYLRPREMPGLEIQEVINSNHSFPNHTHGCHSIGLMEVGCCYCRQPGFGSSFLRGGEIALFNPGLVHSGVLKDSSDRISYRVYSFENTILKKALQELAEKDGLPEFNSIIIKDRLTSGILNNLSQAVAKQADRLALDTALARTAAVLLTRHCATRVKLASGKEPVAVQSVKDYLRENMSSRVELEELSQISGLSRYHLLRIFKENTGLPPHKYHLQQRIEHSKHLLRSGKSFIETSLASGFSDQSHFTNTFRKYTGATPSQYIRGIF